MESTHKNNVGLRVCYHHVGRWIEWERLVKQISPEYVDPSTNLPILGKEDEWHLVMDFQSKLAEEARDYTEAERLMSIRVASARQRVQSFENSANTTWDDKQRRFVRSLAICLGNLANLQRHRDNQVCLTTFKEALALCQIIDDKAQEAIISFNLGNTYLHFASNQDFTEAERWIKRSLELRHPQDQLGRGRCLSVLGQIATERVKKYVQEGKPEREIGLLLDTSKQYCDQALATLPDNANDDLANVYRLLIELEGYFGNIDAAINYTQKVGSYYENRGRTYDAAETYFTMALCLYGEAGYRNPYHYQTAIAFAKSALREYERMGTTAEDKVSRMNAFIREIEDKMRQ